MPIENENVRKFLAYFTSTVSSDIRLLIKAAQKGQKKHEKFSAEGQYAAPLNATISPNQTIWFTGRTMPPRCTVPLAITCLSTMELIGNLFIGYDTDFLLRVKKSFEYAEHPLTHSQRDLLRGIYRNGLMHSFLPKGGKIGISYDSIYESDTNLFVISEDSTILNVNLLSSLTLVALAKIYNDTNVHSIIRPNLEQLLNSQETETDRLVKSLRNG